MYVGTPDIEQVLYQNIRNSLSKITPNCRGGKLFFRWAEGLREVGRSEDPPYGWDTSEPAAYADSV